MLETVWNGNCQTFPIWLRHAWQWLNMLSSFELCKFSTLCSGRGEWPVGPLAGTAALIIVTSSWKHPQKTQNYCTPLYRFPLFLRYFKCCNLIAYSIPRIGRQIRLPGDFLTKRLLARILDYFVEYFLPHQSPCRWKLSEYMKT
jgi:hypothetical protein